VLTQPRALGFAGTFLLNLSYLVSERYGGLSMSLLARRTTARLTVVCLAVIAAAALIPVAQAEDWTKSYAVSGRPQVRVDTNDGAVRVITGDSKQVEFRQDGDSVQISARVSGNWGWSWGHQSRRIQIEVRAPKDADFQIYTGDGAVDTQSINGRLKVHTGDGSVRAQAVSGNVDIETGDGSITVDGAQGDIRLRTGDGHIEGHNLDGRLDANSGDGHIKIDGRLDVLNIKTGDGSINARLRQGSKLLSGWNIRTGDGSVDLVVPADLQANIEAVTHDGRISLSIPVTMEGSSGTSQVRGKMNGGGQPFTIHTGDGSIRLSKS
jgi:DUF4097 and DUF4098 domain-containing protein YvlB